MRDDTLVLPDNGGLAIERRIVAFIIGLENDHAFFTKFDKEREAFLGEFKLIGIKSLTLEDVIDEKKTPIDKCKKWADSDKVKFKKYITYYCDASDLNSDFRVDFIKSINKVNQNIGLPKIG